MSTNLYNKYGYVVKYSEEGEYSINRLKNLYRKKSNKDKVHIVIDGERLDTIAYKYYGNSKYWWVLADANDIKDTLINPFVLDSGTKLLIPDLDNFKSQ